MASAYALLEQLRSYGARDDDVVMLDGTAAPQRQVHYLDLIRKQANDADCPWPDAVVETQGQPILYVVDHLDRARAGGEEGLIRLRRILAFRAGADHVAIAEPGRLTIYPVAPGALDTLPIITVDQDTPGAPGLVPSLAFPPAITTTDGPGSIHRRTSRRAPTVVKNEGSGRTGSSATAVHNLLYKLLTSATLELVNTGVDDLDALSLVGRALFVRFLLDRGVLNARDLAGICGTRTDGCFANAQTATRMCGWLDETFNGDFLPLPHGGTIAWFKKLDGVVFQELSKILSRATPSGQLHLDWGRDWDDLLFDHIPVGLLSQVYEEHAHRFDPVLAKTTSVHYTPRHIAEYVVDEVFFALGEQAAQARVLDPAVGGGVFLVAAFRRLAAERWRADRRPPNTATLREILYNQLRGFDISAPALRLCSLSLYLTAIELDPAPWPPRGLRFARPLLGTVLSDVRSKNRRHIYLGSLDPRWSTQEHNRQYDVVLGNPPWSTWKAIKGVTGKKDIKAQIGIVESAVGEIVRARIRDDRAKPFTMVDLVPDLPFIWKAMEWAREGGQIAFVLHGRILFKQSPIGKRSRDDLFRAITVTGIVNGTAVRDTQYWPGMRQPFCLLFSHNTRPGEDSTFWYVSPELEKTMNDQGKLRIDSADAWPVALAEVRDKPWLLKSLFRGTALDIRLLEQIERVAPLTLGQHWRAQWAGRRKGQGFKVGGDDPNREKGPAKELWGLPKLTRHISVSYLIDTGALKTVEHGLKMQHPRARTIYEAPLVLVPKTPPVDRKRPAAHLALQDLAYNESFTGFSCAAHAEANLLARYLLLLFNSNMLIYLSLLGSGEFGTEREAIQVTDMENLPFRPLDSISHSLRDRIMPLSESLLNGSADILASPKHALVGEIDSFAAEVYGLGRSDVEVIRDTLAVAPPFAHTRARAQVRPSENEIQLFVRRLQNIVQPFLLRRKRMFTVRLLRNVAAEPWIVLQLDSHPKGTLAPPLHDAGALADIIDAADSLAATRIVAIDPPATFLIAIVAQYRYVTQSRARMLGLDLIQEHHPILCGEPS